jgi:hypothetical protein
MSTMFSLLLVVSARRLHLQHLAPTNAPGLGVVAVRRSEASTLLFVRCPGKSSDRIACSQELRGRQSMLATSHWRNGGM